ncbi:rhomboid protease GluP [Pseudobutyrivibrio sp. C4]|uniref:rhomboid family intramembrane serine protease n=1 Tax=Pseudobutyrivibrio sp. C4 TaxID=1520803 RepID=UPI0008D0037F|nr:rhomboid family intramembrane serine protease [Pseudobutyrivibrio sp. C4]SET13936.1 rhomboid protease GluP [Pseudobutyrivibrio sp. C4]
MRDEYFNPKETPITYILVAINIITFVVLEIMGDTTDGLFMLLNGAMNPNKVLAEGEWYRLLTATFMHFGIEHLMNNMLLLFLLGQIFERAVGPVRYLGIYLGSGLTGSFLSFFFMCLMGKNDIVAGASGGIFGIVGGMLIVILVHKGKYKGISTKRMLIMAGLTLYFGFAYAGTDNVGHLGGLTAGIIITFFTYGIPTLIKGSHVDFESEKNYTLKQDDINEE